MSSEKKKAPVLPLALGCVSLAGLLFTCAAFGTTFALYNEADSYDSIAEMEERDEARGYGSAYLGSSYWRRKADDYETYAMGSMCCGVISLLMLFGGAIGGVITFRRHKASGPGGPGGSAPGGGPGTPPPSGGTPSGGTPPPGGGFGPPGGTPPPPGGGFGPPGGTPPPGGGFGPPGGTPPAGGGF